MTTITQTTVWTSSIVHTLAPYRRLQLEMRDLGEQLDQVVFKDRLTTDLRGWVVDFTADLRGQADPHELLERYVTRLQKLLMDPLTNEVIEDEAMLGLSDGVTYGYKAWKIREACLLSEVGDIAPLKEVLTPEFIEPLLMLSREEKVQCSRRSPLNLKDSTFFMMQAHPAISPMLKWLASYDKRPLTPRLDQAYEWLLGHSHIVIRDFYSEKTVQIFTDLAKMHHLLDAGFVDSNCRSLQYFAMRQQDAQHILEAAEQLQAEIYPSHGDQLVLQVREMQDKMVALGELIKKETSPVVATALVRRLTVELQGIGQELEASIWQDETTNTLRKWHESFIRCLRSNKDVGEVLARHIEIVHDILTDPLTNQVVGDNPVLGNDGALYGPKSLANRRAFLLADDEDMKKLKTIVPPAVLAALAKVDRKERVLCSDRSPLDENNPIFFTVQPHPVVPISLQW